MRKQSIVLLVGLAVAAAFGSLRGPVAMWMMERGLARNIALHPIDSLPDGLHALLCGAGGPLPDLQRSGPCVAVIAGRTVVVVDAAGLDQVFLDGVSAVFAGGVPLWRDGTFVSLPSRSAGVDVSAR